MTAWPADGAPHAVDAGLVIGADGVQSLVARTTGAATVEEGRHRCSVVYGYFSGLQLDGTHWYYNRDVAAGAIPTGGGLACVFVAIRPGRYQSRRGTSFDRLFAEGLRETDSNLAQRVAAATLRGKLHPFAGRAGFIRRAWGPGWALVGDAGCFKDPLTAHGMTDALRDAEDLARAAADGSDAALAAYQNVRDSFAVEFLRLSDEIGSLDWDLERVKTLHHQLSKLMNREYDHVRDNFGNVAAAA